MYITLSLIHKNLSMFIKTGFYICEYIVTVERKITNQIQWEKEIREMPTGDLICVFLSREEKI